ncbi:MAG: hypothetical protein JXA46_18995 [Dehalococcoidales bacterium]|nr:hypothetical protein [Dehalococcoidales bacterium]
MEFAYDAIVDYMREYFKTFNAYGQNPDTIHRLDDYFAPDLEFFPYVAGVGHVNGREEFYRVLLSHPSGYEKLTPEDIVVDERRKAAVVLIRAEITDSRTGEMLVKKYYFVLYPLALDENNTIKIKKIQLFWEVLPPGSMEISDVFARDRK